MIEERQVDLARDSACRRARGAEKPAIGPFYEDIEDALVLVERELKRHAAIALGESEAHRLLAVEAELPGVDPFRDLARGGLDQGGIEATRPILDERQAGIGLFGHTYGPAGRIEEGEPEL